MVSEVKFEFTVEGLYITGSDICRLEWAVATISDASQLATFVGKLRFFEYLHGFDDIAREVKYYHELLLSFSQ